MAPESTGGPLAGIKVLDLSTSYAGPFCSMMLADMGATVIKVERPGQGDDARAWGPPFVNRVSAWFTSVNRNKSSITLNLQHPEGRKILFDLIRRSDVFIETFNPVTLERLGLTYEQVRAVNSRIIFAAISGFGLTGPWRDRPGYDLIAQAMSGIMSVTGEPGGRPQKVGTALSDIVAGMLTAFAVSSALLRRERTGQGDLVDVSLLEGQLAVMVPRITAYLASGTVPQPAGGTDSPITLYQPMATADRAIVVATGNDRLWQKFCQVLGRTDLVDHPDFCSNALRTTNKERLIPLLEEILKQQPAAYWLDKLVAAGVPSAPILDLSEVVELSQVRARGMIVAVEHPTAGPMQTVGVPWHLGSSNGQVRYTPAPLLGQHTEEILQSELGLSAHNISRLRESGAI